MTNTPDPSNPTGASSLESSSQIVAPAMPSAVKLRPGARLLSTFAPAAGITFGLFVIMGSLIAAEFSPEETVETRTITSIIPEEFDDDIRIKKHVKPQKIALSDQPPPPPKYAPNKENIDLPSPQILGGAPTELVFKTVQSLDVRPVAISDRDASPLRRPVVAYPTRAQERGIEGNCTVTFNVDVRGQPYDLKADCSDSIFRSSALKAVGNVEFSPKIVKGRAQERRNVVYPIEYNLSS